MPPASMDAAMTPESLLAGVDPHVLLIGGLYVLLILLAGLVVDIGLFIGMIRWARHWTEQAARFLTPRVSGRFLAAGLSVLLFMHGAGLLAGAILPFKGEVSQIVIQSITLHWAILLLTVGLLRRRKADGHLAPFFGLSLRRAGRDIGAGVIAFLGMMPVLVLGTLLYQTLLRAFHITVSFQDVLIHLVSPDHHWFSTLYLFFLAVILAPVAEEILFRGVLLRFAVQRIGVFGGCMLISLLFAMIHMHLPSMAPIFILAFALSLAYLATGSLLVPVVMHILFNAQSLIIMLFMQSNS